MTGDPAVSYGLKWSATLQAGNCSGRDIFPSSSQKCVESMTTCWMMSPQGLLCDIRALGSSFQVRKGTLDGILEWMVALMNNSHVSRFWNFINSNVPVQAGGLVLTNTQCQHLIWFLEETRLDLFEKNFWSGSVNLCVWNYPPLELN